VGTGLTDRRPVLIVDDEAVVRDVVARYLQRDGFATREAADGLEARELLEAEEACLAIVDVMLPGLDGLDLCRWIRSRSSVPVILLTARVDEADRIIGLELGADDYICKPFSPRELTARVRTVLRRVEPQAAPLDLLVFGDVRLERETRELERAGERVPVTPREFDLLWFLASHPRRVFSREQLMERVWGYSAAVDTGTVTVHVRRLREKIEFDPAAPRHLHTVWGAGYRFDP
jgi:DNA-binding response OmpR family regulator